MDGREDYYYESNVLRPRTQHNNPGKNRSIIINKEQKRKHLMFLF